MTFSGNASGTFYTDSGCTNALCSSSPCTATLATGQSSLTFYFKDSSTESLTFSAAASGFTTGNFSTATGNSPILTTVTNSVFPSTYVNVGSTYSVDVNNVQAGSPGNDTGMTYTCVYDQIVDSAVSPGTSCTSLPGYALTTFSSTTGALSWTPTAQAFGPYEIKITGTNSIGSDSQIFVVDVRPGYSTTSLLGDWDAQFANTTAPYSSTGATWNDISGASANGANSDSVHAAWAGDGSAGSPYRIVYDGSGYTDFGTVSSTSTKMMFSAWINPSSAATSHTVLLGNSNNAAGSGFTLRQSATAGKLELLIGNTTTGCTSTSVLANGSWYQISGRYDGANTTLYVNGNLECTYATSTAISSPATDLAAGATAGGSAGWSGSLADLKVYGTSDGTGVGSATIAKTNFDATAERYRAMSVGNIVTSGLILDLDAANGSRGLAFPGAGCTATSWFDLSQSLFNGTLSSFSSCTTYGWQGTGTTTNPYRVVFDGSSSVVSIGNMGTTPTSGTIEFWMNPSSVANYYNPFSTGTGSGNAAIRFEEATGGTFGIVIGNSGGSYTSGTITSSLTASRWYHVAMTWNTTSNIYSVYLNDTAVLANQTNTYWPTNFNNVTLGDGWNGRYFPGSIAKAAIYNTALTAAQIKQNCQALQPRLSGAVCN